MLLEFMKLKFQTTKKIEFYFKEKLLYFHIRYLMLEPELIEENQLLFWKGLIFAMLIDFGTAK